MMKRRKDFTLIELLVVIAVIAILAAMLMPALGKAKQVAKRATCASNMHQYSTCILSYANDFDWGPEILWRTNDGIFEPSIGSYLPPPRYPFTAIKSSPIYVKPATAVYDLTVCPASRSTDPAAIYGCVGDQKVIYGTYLYGFGWGNGGWDGGTYGNPTTLKWYGYCNPVNYAGVPRLSLLGRTHTFGGYTKTLLGPSKQPMLGDLQSYEDPGDLEKTPSLFHYGRMYNHQRTGANTIYLDGHIRWFDIKDYIARCLNKKRIDGNNRFLVPDL